MEKELDYNINDIKNDTKKKKSNYSMKSFLALIANLFSKNNNSATNINLAPISKKKKNETAKTELALHIDKILNLKMYDTYFKVLKEGYQPTSEQKNIFNNYVDHIIRKRDFNTLEKMIDSSVKLENYQKRTLITVDFLSHDFSSNPLKNIDLKEFPLLSSHLNDYIHSDQFSNDIKNHLNRLFQTIISNKKSTMRVSDKIVEFTYILPKFSSFYFKDITEIDFLTLIEQWTNFTQKADFLDESEKISSIQLKNYLMETFNKKHSNYVENLVHQTRSLYLNEHVENYTKNIIINTSINELPKDALKIIEDIKRTYEKLSDSSIKTKNIHTIIEEKLPKIVSIYLRMDEEYRDSLRSVENLTPRQLMIQSLTNIRNHLNSELEEQLEQDVTELSIIKRTTALK